ncbi:protein kinase domain-containing protein, partial [Nitrospira sp. BLG_2]|uniref:protein kinase domain-containing protein n=1 Tax=Nitrospira sp. BLG_2 TaxID=3397507 RepID=UPI003B9BB5B8
MDAPKGPSMLSLSGQIVGTIPYLSPERVKSNDASTSSDTYALGIILYELVTGKYPYPITSDNFETLSNIVHREPASPRKVITEHSSTTIKPTEINGDLERIMLKALAKEPQRRYGSVAEFATDLRHYLSGEAVAARSESKIYVLRKTVRKFRTLVIAGVVCVAILVAALIGVTAAWRRSERVAKIAMAGMEMSGLMKLGGVERDAGRRDQAEENYKKVIELAETIQSDDPLILLQLCRAHQGLTSIQWDKNNPDVAALHAKKSFDPAQKLVQREPENLIYQRLLAFALRDRGEQAFQRENYGLALENFQQAASILKSILATRPDDLNMAGDLASFLNLVGKAARKLGKFDLATQSYTQSYEMYQRLADADPKSLIRRLEFISSESGMAILHFSYKTPEHNMEAKVWLDKADAHLSEVKRRDDASQMLESIDKIRYEITENRSLFERRLAAQNSTPTP